METVNNIELADESIYPDEQVLRAVLGRSYRSFCKLIDLYDRNQLQYEWKYYKDGKAWLCKVQRKKKTIVWMSAWRGYMQATIYFPERLIEQVYSLPIDIVIKNHIKKTKNVGKSKPCIFEIRNQKILKDLETVMQFKIKAK